MANGEWRMANGEWLSSLRWYRLSTIQQKTSEHLRFSYESENPRSPLAHSQGALRYRMDHKPSKRTLVNQDCLSRMKTLRKSIDQIFAFLSLKHGEVMPINEMSVDLF